MEESKKRTLELLDGLNDAGQKKLWGILKDTIQKEVKKIKKPKAFTSVSKDFFDGVKLIDAADWENPFEKCLPSNWLNESLEKIKKFGKMSNEFSTRTVIDQILYDVLEYAKKYQLWYELDVDIGEIGGRIDYVIAKSTVGDEPEKPYIVAVEAKHAKFKVKDINKLKGEIFACLKANNDGKSVYGILTNGDIWQFFKLDGELKLTRSETYWRGDHLNKILGIIYAMIISRDKIEITGNETEAEIEAKIKVAQIQIEEAKAAIETGIEAERVKIQINFEVTKARIKTRAEVEIERAETVIKAAKERIIAIKAVVENKNGSA